MSSEDSSSEEDIQKLKEATWSFGPATTNGSQTAHSNGSDKKEAQSRRTVASEHENDGNELETTPEFRAHVAKKLGTVLDSCIAEVSVATVDSSNVESDKCNEGEEDEGFRLFSTSVPGVSAPAPAPSRKRPIPSSSDSDSEKEMRIREAAVTLSDIVRPYYTEKPDLGDKAETKEHPCENLVTEKKKKKKRKKKKVPKLQEENEDEEKASPDDGNAQIQTSTQETSQPEQMKKKKRKKKKVDISQVNERIRH